MKEGKLCLLTTPPAIEGLAGLWSKPLTPDSQRSVSPHLGRVSILSFKDIKATAKAPAITIVLRKRLYLHLDTGGNHSNERFKQSHSECVRHKADNSIPYCPLTQRLFCAVSTYCCSSGAGNTKYCAENTLEGKAFSALICDVQILVEGRYILDKVLGLGFLTETTGQILDTFFKSVTTCQGL